MNNYKQCYICGDAISIGTTCDNCWQKEQDRKKEMDNRPKLVPRSFKIEQNINEYTYTIKFYENKQKWCIVEKNEYGEYYLSSPEKQYPYEPQIVFDTPELALEAWTKWYIPVIDNHDGICYY